MIENVNFVCLGCGGSYTKAKHLCNDSCLPLEKGVCHIDFCKLCIELHIVSFEKQMRVMRLPPFNPIHVEEK